jgi:hypothetical protein
MLRFTKRLCVAKKFVRSRLNYTISLVILTYMLLNKIFMASFAVHL